MPDLVCTYLSQAELGHLPATWSCHSGTLLPASPVAPPFRSKWLRRAGFHCGLKRHNYHSDRGSSWSSCCKRRIHEPDSNPAPLSFRDSALPIRLPGITLSSSWVLLATLLPRPNRLCLRAIPTRGVTMGQGFEFLIGRQCCKIRIHERDSNPAPLSFRELGYQGSHTLMGPSCYTARPRLAASFRYDT